MKRDFTLRRNADGTATFRTRNPDTGRRYIEHLDPRLEGPFTTFERIKWAARTANLNLSDDLVEDLMREARGLKP